MRYGAIGGGMRRSVAPSSRARTIGIGMKSLPLQIGETEGSTVRSRTAGSCGRADLRIAE